MISYHWELNDSMSLILQIWDNFYVISLQVLTEKKRSTIRVYQYSRVRWFPALPWYIQNSGVLRIPEFSEPEAYSELWHIQSHRHFQNPGLFRTLGHSEPEAYSETCQTSTIEPFKKQLTSIIIFASYNCFRSINFSCPPVHEINIIFLM